MKKRILLAISVLLVLGMSIVAFAYKTNDRSLEKAMSCCCKDGSCPMKNKGTTDAQTAASCCDNPDCCCKGGDSCPMKAKGETAQTTGADMKNVKFVSSDENCDRSCCKHKQKS